MGGKGGWGGKGGKGRWGFIFFNYIITSNN